MAQKPRPSGTIRTPNYPRLSSLAIAAALTACNGEVRTPMDGVGGNPDSSGGASSTIMGSTAGITVSPYGGQGGVGSATEGTTVVGTGGSGEIGNPAGDMAPPFGGSGSTAPEATGGRPPVYSTGTGGSSGIGDPTGGLAVPFGGSGSTAPEAAGGTPDMGNPAGKMSPSFGGSASVAMTAMGGVSPQTTTLTGGRSGTGGTRIANGGGTSTQVFTTPAAPSSGTSPKTELPD